MRLPHLRIRDLPGAAAAGLHVLLLLAVVAVPICAITRALYVLTSADQPGQIEDLIDVRRWLTLLGNTGIVCGVALVTATVLGLVFGFLVARTDLPGRTVLILTVVLGACVPVYVSVVFIFSVIPVWRFAHSAVACGLMHGLIYTPLA